MNDLPGKIMVWHGPHPLPHAGSWATTRYPQEAEEYVKVAALPGMVQQWQPIETAPKDGTCILIFDGEEVHEVNWGKSWIDTTPNWAAPFSDQDEQGGRYEFTPTHWMPLPAAPVGVQGGET